RLAAVEQEAAVHLPARLGGQRLERLAVDVEGVEGALVGQRHAGGHGAYAELLVPRRPHLPRDDDVEGGVEGAGDLVAEDDAPAREAEADGSLAAVGPAPLGELAAGVLPVLEEAAVGHGGAALVRGTPSYAGAPPPFALRRRGSPQFGYPSLPPSSDEEGVGGWLIGMYSLGRSVTGLPHNMGDTHRSEERRVGKEGRARWS